MNGLKRLVFFVLTLFFICLLLSTPLAWAQSDGEWSGTTNEGGDVFFTVSGNNVQDFLIEICVSGGSGGFGCFEEYLDFSMPISGNNFSYTSWQFELTGTFTSSNTCTGTWAFHDGYMGYGSGTWSASFPASSCITLSPSSQGFGDQAINTRSSAVTFTLRNKGGGTATGSVSLTGTNADQFEITSGGGSFSLTHGQSKDIYVRFVPTSEGSKTATLMVDGDSPCNDVSATLAGTGATRPESKLTASDGASDDYFGTAVSMSGDYAIVGASKDDDNGTNSGSAYVFERTGSGWIQLAKLTASDGASDDYFGRTVSISGDYAIVGTIEYDYKLTTAGSAYIFEKPIGGWADMTETAKLTASDGRSFDYFGIAVSISGDYAIVGASNDSVNGLSSGSAYIFEKPIGGWADMTETAKLTASDRGSLDYFGTAVSISGDYAIVGAKYDDDNGLSSGSAYIFEKPIGGWADMTETAKLTASDGAAEDFFGSSVSISGDYAIVGAKYDDDNGLSSGSAYIFEKPIGGWADMTETAKLTASDGDSSDYFGTAVSISEDYAIVGANGQGAYKFKKSVEGWADMTETIKLTASLGDIFGKAVSISGDYAIVGAPGDDDNGLSSGSAYIYYIGNLPPTISDINDQIAIENTPTDAINFTISDSETLPEDLILTGISSNSTLVPNENIVLEGTGVNRTITITPAPDEVGTTTITITVNDGINAASDSFLLTVIVASDTDGDGNMASDDLWIRAVIKTEEKGDINAVWQKKGDAYTDRGDRVIWGHFYASPSDVTWGSQNNPDLFVKIWFDVSGRVDVNFFHVSVPDIVVYSDYPYGGSPDEQGTTTMDRRYIRQYYENGQSNSDENYEDGNPPSGYSPTGNPFGYSTINDIRIGSIINTVEKGPIDAVWRLGGQDTTARGDQVVWGHFYANPTDVTWGSENNPDLFVKIWFDVSGRTDVNFFHVSVPDIEVYSDLPDDGTYDQQGTTIMDNRYIRHEYWR